MARFPPDGDRFARPVRDVNRTEMGIGICQIGLARRDPRLIRLFPDEMTFLLETWVTMHGDLRSNRRMRLVFDHLVKALTDYVKT